MQELGLSLELGLMAPPFCFGQIGHLASVKSVSQTFVTVQVMSAMGPELTCIPSYLFGSPFETTPNRIAPCSRRTIQIYLNNRTRRAVSQGNPNLDVVAAI